MGLRLRIMSGRARCKCTIGSATIRAIFQGGMAMKRCGLLIAMMLTISGCGPSDQEKQISKVETRLKEHLKDPDSAKIVVTEIFPMFDGEVACGTVNSKNSFGGYTGEMSFILPMSETGTMWNPSIADSELLSSLLPDSCAFIKAYAQRPGMVGVPAGLEQLRAFSKEYLPFAEKSANEALQRQRRE